MISKQDLIIKDDLLKNLFLKYIKFSHLLNDIPDEPPQNLTKAQAIKFISISNTYNQISTMLINQLNAKYCTLIENTVCTDETNQLIINVSQFYIDKYGLNEIMKMNFDK